MILRGDSEKFEYLSEDKTKNENTYFNPLVHWTRPVRMMKKTRGPKSHSTVPLKEKNEDDNFKLHFNIVGQRALLV